MTNANKTLTTGEYSKVSGLSTTTITKMLRAGKLTGRKIDGKWAIDAEQSQTDVPAEKKTQETSPTLDKKVDLPTFANMTYLTEKGVRQWVKSGRLSAIVDEQGNLLIDADNLNRPEMRHLIRK